MADHKTAQEPSMEEILSSIRRIIAEDEPGAAGAAAQSAAAGAEDLEDEDDVLELTEIVDEPAAAPPVSAAPTPPPAPPAPSPSPQESKAMAAPSADSLISPVAASASTNAFARLAKAATPEEPRPAAVAGITVDQLVIDLLTPMLRDWLDQNLPAIVERVVEQEVKKLARRAELM